MNSLALARLILTACEDKKGFDPIILDVRKQTNIADYFVIVHGSSERHAKTLAENIMDVAETKGEDSFHVEGMNFSKWILIDFGSVIAHVFYHETRKFYNLERLWGDAKPVKGIAKRERKAKKTH